MGDSNLIEGRVAGVGAAGGEARIKTALGIVPLDQTLEAGRAVTLMIRPEKLAIEPRSEGMIALGRARVTESLFQGTHVRLRALAGPQGEVELMLRLALGAEAAVDSEIEVWADPADVVVLDSD